MRSVTQIMPEAKREYIAWVQSLPGLPPGLERAPRDREGTVAGHYESIELDRSPGIGLDRD